MVAADKALVATGEGGSGMPSLGKLKIATVVSQTKAVGVIVPPPDIR